MTTETKATLIAATEAQDRDRTLVTFELTYPRFIHPQMRAHRSIVQNVASNRARPTSMLIDQVRNDPVPFRWRLRAKSGMQPSNEEVPADVFALACKIEAACRESVLDSVAALEELGIAKELVNRLLEPWQWCESVATSTLENWWHFCSLRVHEDAQLEIRELANLVERYLRNIGNYTSNSHVHLPYKMTTEEEKTEAQALFAKNFPSMGGYETYLQYIEYAVCAARCARVSYTPFGKPRRSVLDDLKLFLKLTTAQPMHASPLEHVAFQVGVPQKPVGPFPGWVALRHSDLLRDVQFVIEKICLTAS